MKQNRRIRYVHASSLEIKTMLEALDAFEEAKRRQDLEFEEIIKTANMIRHAPARNDIIQLKLREKESHEVLCKALDELNKAKKEKKISSDRTFAVFLKVYNAPTSKETEHYPELER